jgi:hypothetical protein
MALSKKVQAETRAKVWEFLKPAHNGKWYSEIVEHCGGETGVIGALRKLMAEDLVVVRYTPAHRSRYWAADWIALPPQNYRPPNI